MDGLTVKNIAALAQDLSFVSSIHNINNIILCSDTLREFEPLEINSKLNYVRQLEWRLTPSIADLRSRIGKMLCLLQHTLILSHWR